MVEKHNYPKKSENLWTVKLEFNGGSGMLVLPIKKKWFYMILTGEKREEYRDVKPYYTTRLNKIFNMVDDIPLDYAEAC